MKKLLFLAFLLFSPLVAQAALPPGAESLRRLAAVAESPEVFKAVGAADWVKSINDNDHGTYTVVTSKCTLEVKLDVVPMDHPGPNPLRVIPGKMLCR